MKIGMVITVKNEARILRWNLLYHRSLGVDRFFIYDDGCTDDTKSSIRDIPGVSVAPSVDPNRFKHRPELERYRNSATSRHTARQCLNAVHAVELARLEGLGWLIFIDADELVTPDVEKVSRNCLKVFFSTVPDPVEAVRFPVFEIVPRRIDHGNVFAEEILFKRPGARIAKPVWDPYRKKILRLKGFFGHTEGKCALRLSVNAIATSTHHFSRPNGTELREQWAGGLLHYNCYGFSQFVKKFREMKNFPDTWTGGHPLPYLPTRLWRAIVNDDAFSEEDLEAYYRRWVLFDDTEIRRAMDRRLFGVIPARPFFVRIRCIQRFFGSSKFGVDEGIAP